MNSLNSRIGRVYLVGAGPGDPGLITVRGAQKLKEADVVLHDGLTNPALQSIASPSAAWISVGKHGGDRIWKQSEIDDAIVLHARMGKTVVRLKGGDTTVFARTAEELDRLIGEEIPFEVIPGITAALAVSAYTGIPITHRDWSSAVALVTGQMQSSDGGTETDEVNDWNALAKFPGTLVVYMGVTTAPIWSKRLLDAGMRPQTPVAIVRHCSWPDQEAIYCKLDQVAEVLTPASRFRPPVVAIIGAVAHLGSRYDWFGKRPLKGTTVLVARPAGQASETAQRLEDLGAKVIVQSGIEICPLDDFTMLDARLESLSTYDWLVFTSTNGVDSFFNRLHALGLDGRALHRCQIAGVGPSIASALDRWKLVCDLLPDGEQGPFNAESLAQRLLGKLNQRKDGKSRSLVVRTTRGKRTVEEALMSAGYPVDSVIAYQSIDIVELDPQVRATLESKSVDYILVTSRSIASSLTRLLGPQTQPKAWIAISEDVTDLLRSQGAANVVTAKQSSIDSMIESLLTQL